MIKNCKKILNKLRKKTSFFCPVCQQKNIIFLPLPSFYHENAKKNGHIYFGRGEMTAQDTYTCSGCGASDRERLYAYWLNQQIELNRIRKGVKLIHFAPEQAFSAMLRKNEFFEYKTADLSMENVDFRVDMMSMPFADQSFGFFVCSHVLEHVESDDRAIQELSRITKIGGSGILMAPICIDLNTTYEDPLIITEEERWKYFGQNDHVRLYAHDDYVNKIKKHGFSVKEYGINHFGIEIFQKLGLKKTSILYIVEKQ